MCNFVWCATGCPQANTILKKLFLCDLCTDIVPFQGIDRLLSSPCGFIFQHHKWKPPGLACSDFKDLITHVSTDTFVYNLSSSTDGGRTNFDILSEKNYTIM